MLRAIVRTDDTPWWDYSDRADGHRRWHLYHATLSAIGSKMPLAGDGRHDHKAPLSRSPLDA